ncbi:uncharacterized protein [Miscanthus floridulus]|uniref:uncharacterized protein n=1 Tax=Miscanthus floridulus TaxID=154761 RepID=UPI0034587882
MYFDGSVMAPGSGAGVVLISPDGSRLCYAIRLHFLPSNNATEYEALINGLCIAIELGATRLYICGDLELVIDQVMKESSCKRPLMVAYYQEVSSLDGVFINDLHEPSTPILEGLIQTHLDTNLAFRGSDLSASMTTSPVDVAVVALDPTDWRAPLLTYLLEEILPPERTEA